MKTKQQSMLYIITPDGKVEEEILNDKLSLERAQELVGGYVEIVPMFHRYESKSCAVLCDEEGKLKGYPINMHATHEWYKNVPQARGQDVLVGTIVIVCGPAYRSWR